MRVIRGTMWNPMRMMLANYPFAIASLLKELLLPAHIARVPMLVGSIMSWIVFHTFWYNHFDHYFTLMQTFPSPLKVTSVKSDKQQRYEPPWYSSCLYCCAVANRLYPCTQPDTPALRCIPPVVLHQQSLEGTTLTTTYCRLHVCFCLYAYHSVTVMYLLTFPRVVLFPPNLPACSICVTLAYDNKPCSTSARPSSTQL